MCLESSCHLELIFPLFFGVQGKACTLFWAPPKTLLILAAEFDAIAAILTGFCRWWPWWECLSVSRGCLPHWVVDATEKSSWNVENCMCVISLCLTISMGAKTLCSATAPFGIGPRCCSLTQMLNYRDHWWDSFSWLLYVPSHSWVARYWLVLPLAFWSGETEHAWVCVCTERERERVMHMDLKLLWYFLEWHVGYYQTSVKACMLLLLLLFLKELWKEMDFFSSGWNTSSLNDDQYNCYILLWMKRGSGGMQFHSEWPACDCWTITLSLKTPLPWLTLSWALTVASQSNSQVLLVLWKGCDCEAKLLFL